LLVHHLIRENGGQNQLALVRASRNKLMRDGVGSRRVQTGAGGYVIIEPVLCLEEHIESGHF
jgi:hypothetical protein